MVGERLDLDAVQARAEAAMSGPWEYRRFRLAPGVVKPTPDGKATDYVIAQMVNAGKDTAEHIAGMDPQTTLALVAELRAAREVIERQGVLLSATRGVVEATREVGHGPSAMHWSPSCIQCQALTAYEKVTGEASR
jgi:hypothetical protein